MLKNCNVPRIFESQFFRVKSDDKLVFLPEDLYQFQFYLLPGVFIFVKIIKKLINRKDNLAENILIVSGLAFICS